MLRARRTAPQGRAKAGLRPDRPGRVPAAVAERPLHGQGPAPSTGRRLSIDPASMPATRPASPSRPRTTATRDGFSPGSIIVTKVPGLDTPEALAKTNPVPITDLARTYDRWAPVVVINARTLRRQLIWAELDSGHLPRRHRAAHPPGQELPRGRALHRRAEEAPRGRREAARGEPGVQASTATGSRRVRGTSSGAAAMESLFRTLGRRGSPATTSTGPGTSRSRARGTSRAACARSATTRSRSWETASSATSR